MKTQGHFKLAWWRLVRRITWRKLVMSRCLTSLYGFESVALNILLQPFFFHLIYFQICDPFRNVACMNFILFICFFYQPNECRAWCRRPIVRLIFSVSVWTSFKTCRTFFSAFGSGKTVERWKEMSRERNRDDTLKCPRLFVSTCSETLKPTGCHKKKHFYV